MVMVVVVVLVVVVVMVVSGGDGDGGEPNLKKDNVVLPPEQFLSEGADPRMGLDLNED